MLTPTCKFYLNDTCKRGVKCPFTHSRPDDAPQPSSQSNQQKQHPHNNKKLESGPSTCSYYLKGSCKYGEACHFAHPFSTPVSSSDTKSSESASAANSTRPAHAQVHCKYWKSGFCQYGASCRFKHDFNTTPSGLVPTQREGDDGLEEGEELDSDTGDVTQTGSSKTTSLATPRSPSPSASGHSEADEEIVPLDETHAPGLVMPANDNLEATVPDTWENPAYQEAPQEVHQLDTRRWQSPLEEEGEYPSDSVSDTPQVPLPSAAEDFNATSPTDGEDVHSPPQVEDDSPEAQSPAEGEGAEKSLPNGDSEFNQCPPALPSAQTQPAHFQEPHWTEYADPHATPFIPFCKHLARGKCHQQSSCKFRHSLTIHDHFILFLDANPPVWNRTLLSLQNIPNFGEPSQAQSNSDTRTRTRTGFGVCKFYPLGKCRNGDACPYAHIAGEADTNSKVVQEEPLADQPETPRQQGGDWSKAEPTDWDAPAADSWSRVEMDWGVPETEEPVQEMPSHPVAQDDEQEVVLNEEARPDPQLAQRVASYTTAKRHCRHYARGRCFRGDSCSFLHEDPSGGSYLQSSNAKGSANYDRARPERRDDTLNAPWDTRSQRSYAARSGSGWSSNDDRASAVPESYRSQNSRPAPGYATRHGVDQSETWNDSSDGLGDQLVKILKPCRFFGQGHCTIGDQCAYLHIDQPNRGGDGVELEDEPEWPDAEIGLDWDASAERQPARGKFCNCTVTYGPGCEVERVETEHESAIINIRGMPRDTARQDVIELVKDYGYPLNVSLLEVNDSITARVEFLNADPAFDAVERLSKQYPLFSIVRGEDPLSSDSFNSLPPDRQTTKLRVIWPAPSIQAWCHYPTISAAKAEEARLSGLVFSQHKIKATFHSPRRGQTHSFAVQLTNLPINISRQEVEGLCKGATLVVIDRPPYTQSPVAQVIELVHSFNRSICYEIPTPAEGDNKHTALFEFATSYEAESVARSLGTERPEFLGGARISAQFIHYMRLSVPSREFKPILGDFSELKKQSPTDCRLECSDQNGNTIILIQAQATSIGAFNTAISMVRKLLKGQTVCHEGKPLWDDYFNLPTSTKVIERLNANNDTSYFIICNPRACTISVLGNSAGQEKARTALLRIRDKVHLQQTIIPITPWIMRPLLHGGLRSLWEEYGEFKVTLDVLAQQLVVQGGPEVAMKVEQSLTHSQPDPSSNPYDPTCQLCLHVARHKELALGTIYPVDVLRYA
ncbi:hypothetical protein AX16_010425 [Volvariella volvacea WC 439]|nr:hypothetical protein AX16_010425 [Volvariella volvacea WC 439]